MSQPAQSPLQFRSTVFLLHIALEIPVAIQGIWSPASLPLLELNNTTIAILKLYAALSFASCIAAFLCFSLPEFLPGKRALAIGLTVYHCIASTILFQAPRFIPHSFGELFESFKLTPEVLWGTLHGVIGLGFVSWWQATVALTSSVRKMQ
ncbi:uncharacterized protein FOMMEDRAFT_142896 [Fomitiporia mediterranea MF3/22]|uniref:uncharacterized protein n=1 Tax=Fomitiporia mediterranea (strain MF3/22) TaxID=694068 RepID=UPI0004409574|nr:uncharacterized protein FOMMEDRAFT_142896 [Fomitiporia mediterranea MF3/22]EJC99362.1 hypothetical protein FOMMEDRAFT_142896 [Fomitiporia mediterranea MF3/22]